MTRKTENNITLFSFYWHRIMWTRLSINLLVLSNAVVGVLGASYFTCQTRSRITTNSDYWESLAGNSDGSKFVGSIFDTASIVHSNDGAKTFVSQPHPNVTYGSNGQKYTVACSSDSGQYLILASSGILAGNQEQGVVLSSSDFGQNWTQAFLTDTFPVYGAFTDCAISAGM